MKIVLTGHTRRISSEEYNQKLAEARITMVSEFLIERGVDPSGVRTEASDESEPINETDTEDVAAVESEAASSNRRVTVKTNMKRES